MPQHDSLLASRAFGEHADDRLIVAYHSHQDALRFLSTALGEANGVALLQGPAGAGKTTIINELRDWSSRDAAVAHVEGTHLTPRQLVSEMLSQFRVQTVIQDDEQSLQQLSDFLTQQVRSARPPVLIVDNIEFASPSALRLLNWLAALDVVGIYALRIILTAKKRLLALLREDGMHSLARRHPATYSLNPMTAHEAMIYLRTRLIAAGSERSEKVFTFDVCERLHELSCGWPGALNERAIEVIDRMTELQSARPMPNVIVTCDGETVAELELTERQYVIGRTELADIVIEDDYVSKMHAMFQVYANAVVLHDLNSTNGTTVNATAVQKTILRNNDIIALGRHRLKIENAPAISAEIDEQIRATDTVTIQDPEEIRRLRAVRTITALKNRQPG